MIPAFSGSSMGLGVGALDELMDRVEADYRYKETLSTWAGQGVFLADS